MLAVHAVAVTRYVDLNSSTPTPPYLNWTTAATNIQNAIDAAADGDLILVTNGIYQTGGLVVHGDITNRIAITKPITVQSVNGFGVTVIRGYQVPGTTNGNGAVRCAYLTNGASLIGFTLTNGATTTSGGTSSPQWRGGGAYCESTDAFLRDCLIVGNVAYYLGGGVVNGALTNCELRANVANVGLVAAGGGGGAYQSTLNSCVISSNLVHRWYGGGTLESTLSDCVIVGNRNLTGVSEGGGAGVQGGYISNCVVIANQILGGRGGGVSDGACFNSLIVSNAAISSGGADNSTLNNCVLVGNVATNAGGAFGGSLINCTVVENSAANRGGGIYNSAAANSIVYYNRAPNNNSSNQFGSTLAYSCIHPHVPEVGNFTNAPQFVNLSTGDLRLQSNSPCINAGDNAFTVGEKDRAANSRVVGGAVDMGAYEFQFPASLISYAWLLQYGFPTDGSADLLDNDVDGMSNYREWRSDTIPTNASSVLRMITVTKGVSGADVTWQSVPTRSYWLERATNLSTSPFEVIATYIFGEAGITSHTDSAATNSTQYFYRVGVY